jgi:hypothetical protein
MEAPVYISMAEELERRLHALVSGGALGLVTNDSFFLFTDGDLVVIVHVVAIEPSCVHFQMRGLEYVQQTICHGGELSIVQQVALEQTQFGNIAHALAFTFTMWDIRAKDVRFEMVTVSRYVYQDTVYAPLGRDLFEWYFNAAAFVCARRVTVVARLPQTDSASSRRSSRARRAPFRRRRSLGSLEGLLNNGRQQELFNGRWRRRPKSGRR